MTKRGFGGSFAVEASPWPVTSPGWEWQTGIFPGGSPGDFAPFFSSFYRLVCGGSVDPLLSLVLVRVIREEPAPLSGRDVYLRFTLFQVHVPWISHPGAVTKAVTTCVKVAKLCLGYSRRST